MVIWRSTATVGLRRHYGPSKTGTARDALSSPNSVKGREGQTDTCADGNAGLRPRTALGIFTGIRPDCTPGRCRRMSRSSALRSELRIKQCLATEVPAFRRRIVPDFTGDDGCDLEITFSMVRRQLQHIESAPPMTSMAASGFVSASARTQT